MTALQQDAVKVEGLVRRFGAHTVIDGLDLHIAPGEFVCLLGRSGCGKTTLLRTIAGLEAPDAGEVDAPRRKSIIFQEPRLLPWRDVLFNVCFGSPRDPQARDKALSILAEVGLEQHVDAYPASLSGGQAQRVALARALIRSPALLLMDEPFAALDALTRLQMQGLVRELCRTHRPASLLVTHDVSEAIALGDRILVMRAGRFITDVSTRSLRASDDYERDFLKLQHRLLDDLQVPRENHAGTT